MPSPFERVRPPGGVRFAGWMIGIGAFLWCLIGVILLFVTPDQATLDELGVGRGIFQIVGFVLLAIGLLEFLLIYALWDGSRVARIIATVLVGLSLLGALGQALSGGPGGFASVLQAGVAIAILIGLWGTPSATEFFARPERPTGGVPLASPPPPPPPAP